MKKVMGIISKITENHYVNLLISIGLIVIGFEELYKQDVLHIEIHWKHGISIYAILMCIRAIYKIIKGFVEAYNRLTKKETPVKAS
ncbi:conserved hypothetical protein [Tenacibaculum litopenaei]|jgi:uncharacterized membrane protein|uniref:hypothetical protein n=1 Tax=Tenacibaculum litopenaei TaxID=396016 RepID=UPI003894A42E